MRQAEITPAPRWRRVLAAIADVTIAGGVVWLRRRRWRMSAAAQGRTRWAALFAPTGELLREQVGSPGQHLLGVRTVDRRTGRRVELWRTLALLVTRVGGQLLVRRMVPSVPTPEQERERRRFGEEMSAVYERHPEGSREREAELAAILERYPSPIAVKPWRWAGPILALGLINGRLRRRLAPTTEVLARPR